MAVPLSHEEKTVMDTHKKLDGSPGHYVAWEKRQSHKVFYDSIPFRSQNDKMIAMENESVVVRG